MRVSASAVALLMALAALPFGGAQDEIPMTQYAEISLGFPYSENFDAGNGSWTANPVPPQPVRAEPQDSTWEWGVPTSGPGSAASGSNVWATNLDGATVRYECGAIMTPPIDLTSATTASVSFMQWHHTQQSSFGSGFIDDAALLYVTADGGDTLAVVDPDQGYDGPLGFYARRCLDDAPSGTQGIGGPAGTTPPAPEYALMSADLSAFAGQTVQFLIAFGSNCCTYRDGFYIDDLNITIDGVSTIEDFEDDDGGLQVVSTALARPGPKGWSWGVPGAGPGSDSPMWATNPEGDYGDNECSWAESPSIDLTDYPVGAGVVTARLTWDQWFRSNSIYAAGIVQVGVPGSNGTDHHYVVPEGGYDGSASGTYEDQLVACLGAEALDAAFSGPDDSTGADLTGQLVDLTPFLGNEVTVRFLFASASSSLNPTLYPGWYVDNVDVELRATVNGPDVETIVNELIPTPGSGTDAPLWTSGGEDSSWAYGVASVGPAGDTVYGTNLDGNHVNGECSWIESPEIPTAALLAQPTLTFEHWFDMYLSTFSGNAWNGGVVLVSSDGGATWQYVESDSYSAPVPYSGLEGCIASYDPNAPDDPMVFSGTQEFYSTVTMDLSDHLDGATVKVRFLFGTSISISREGWYVRSVDVGGISLL